MSAFYGTPADIEELPTPAATVNIASSTNATPIVVTTSGNHGLQSGQAFIINGHATNTNANGIWIAAVVDANEVELLNFDGTDSTGNGVGGATGTVQSLALPGVTLPEDMVNAIDAACWNVPIEALQDMVQWLAYRILANMTILKGGTLTIKNGGDLVVASGGTATVNSGGELAVASGGLLTIYGYTGYLAAQRPSDGATINVDVADGDNVILATPAALRNVVVANCSVATARMRITMPPDIANGHHFDVKRADATLICELWGSSVLQASVEVDVGGWVELECASGVWRGLCYGGQVVPGAGW
jgi:autotransporter passenger strand-loop-strand repeat protein